MKKTYKIIGFALIALFVFELAGCKTVSKALGIPYGQAKKTIQIKK